MLSILRFFAGMYEHFSPEQARHFLPHVLNPIHRILDEGGDLASTDPGQGLGKAISIRETKLISPQTSCVNWLLKCATSFRVKSAYPTSREHGKD